MAVDYFLKIDGIDGESTDAKHKNEIQIESFSWGVSNSGSAAHPGTSGASAGKAAFSDFSFVTRTSKATPQLFLAAASGTHLKSALLTARKAGKTQQEFLKIAMTDVLVSSVSEQGTSATDEAPADSVSLNFAKIQVEYHTQAPDGTLGPPVKSGWDLKQNKGT